MVSAIYTDDLSLLFIKSKKFFNNKVKNKTAVFGIINRHNECNRFKLNLTLET